MVLATGFKSKSRVTLAQKEGTHQQLTNQCTEAASGWTSLACLGADIKLSHAGSDQSVPGVFGRRCHNRRVAK